MRFAYEWRDERGDWYLASVERRLDDLALVDVIKARADETPISVGLDDL